MIDDLEMEACALQGAPNLLVYVELNFNKLQSSKHVRSSCEHMRSVES